MTNERLNAISEMLECPNPEYESGAREIRQMARELLALRWQKITPDNLPKVGDEVIDLKKGSIDVIDPEDEALGHESLRQFGFTYFRPINAPATCQK